ncbi:putative membrane protein [Clostridium sp. N3C]|uniref:ECF transporter S component n=1 Tax=Clostridium sp. N3C TaxID=1776758 RepID=UPI00092DF9AC|nr:ECF transporter S component [Clostridium sp. N3C]SCN24673.1 putative membrane protein [Clostridium sp. N3C]
MNKNCNTTVKLTVTAMFMAMNIVLSSFGIPIPGGHLYFNNIVICLSSILIEPLQAFVVGGIGAFIGDFLFYPAPMFVSLVTHGLQAVAISLFSHRFLKNNPRLASGIGVAVGALITTVGYSLGRAFVYSTPEYALMNLPFQILQAMFSAVVGMLLCWNFGIHKLYTRITNSKHT